MPGAVPEHGISEDSSSIMGFSFGVASPMAALALSSRSGGNELAARVPTVAEAPDQSAGVIELEDVTVT